MASEGKLSESFLVGLGKNMQVCPKVNAKWFNTWDFTRPGDNLCHARMLGFLTKTAWEIAEAVAVEIDVQLGRYEARFKPDIVVRNKDDEPFFIVDFESPNSSDARIPRKDVKSYINWISYKDLAMEKAPEYLILTTLPDAESTEWKMRYTSQGRTNFGHRENVKAIRRNPFRYWYKFYQETLDPSWNKLPIIFANLEGIDIRLVDMKKDFRSDSL